MTDDGPDDGSTDDLLRRLRAADPALDLPALPPGRLDQLLEDTVTSTRETSTPETTPTRRRSPLLLAAAAAGVLAVGGGAVYLAAGDGGGTTVLSAQPGGGPATACAEVTPETLAAAEVAFAARVTGVADGVVTLETTERFAGDVGDTVEVTQGDSGVVLDGAPLELQPGVTYLLTADDGAIGSCSGSGPDSPELRALFEAAFPG